MKKLIESLKRLVYLFSVELNFADCAKMEKLERLFKTLQEMKNIKEVRLSLPYCDQEDEIVKNLNREKFISILFA